MKVTVTFEESNDHIGNGWTSTFSYDNIEYAEDLLYALGRAATGAGFDFNGLEARQNFNHHVTGERMSNTFRAEF